MLSTLVELELESKYFPEWACYQPEPGMRDKVAGDQAADLGYSTHGL